MYVWHVWFLGWFLTVLITAAKQPIKIARFYPVLTTLSNWPTAWWQWQDCLSPRSNTLGLRFSGGLWPFTPILFSHLAIQLSHRQTGSVFNQCSVSPEQTVWAATEVNKRRGNGPICCLENHVWSQMEHLFSFLSVSWSTVNLTTLLLLKLILISASVKNYHLSFQVRWFYDKFDSSHVLTKCQKVFWYKACMSVYGNYLCGFASLLFYLLCIRGLNPDLYATVPTVCWINNLSCLDSNTILVSFSLKIKKKVLYVGCCLIDLLYSWHKAMPLESRFRGALNTTRVTRINGPWRWNNRNIAPPIRPPLWLGQKYSAAELHCSGTYFRKMGFPIISLQLI